MSTKILYIEDETLLGRIVQESLESRGYQMDWYLDGDKAKDALENAELMARSFGQEIESVYAISKSDNFGRYFSHFNLSSPRFAAYADHDAPSQYSSRYSPMRTFAPSTIEIGSSVNIVVKIREKN